MKVVGGPLHGQDVTCSCSYMIQPERRLGSLQMLKHHAKLQKELGAWYRHHRYERKAGIIRGNPVEWLAYTGPLPWYFVPWRPSFW